MSNRTHTDTKSNIIGVCVSQLQNKENASLMHTIYQSARENGYRFSNTTFQW